MVKRLKIVQGFKVGEWVELNDYTRSRLEIKSFSGNGLQAHVLSPCNPYNLFWVDVKDLRKKSNEPRKFEGKPTPC